MGHVKKNYMVNIGNVKYLEKLVLNNGKLTKDDFNKYLTTEVDQSVKDDLEHYINDDVELYYFVLIDQKNKIIGDIVFSYNKAKNEIEIPALQIDAALQGQQLGLILILQVMTFAQKMGNVPIKLQTGHHENSGESKERLVKAMRSFYIKLGFKLEAYDSEAWHQKNPIQKLAEFRNDHDQCIFEFEPRNNQMVFAETIKAACAYLVKEPIDNIVIKHCQILNANEKKDAPYRVYDLLTYQPYVSWLNDELIKWGVAPEDIETSCKLLINRARSQHEIETLGLIQPRNEHLQLDKALSTLPERPYPKI